MGPQGKIKQKGKYYYKAPDKLRFDIKSPIKQSMILIGQKVYMNTGSGSKYIESSVEDITAKLYSSNLFGYHYLKQYVYEEQTNTYGCPKRYKYEKIDGIVVPVRIDTRVNFQLGQRISVIRLKEY
ncbi:MAG TPA: hypothetical protein ENI51_04785 [Candidatus Atribacteria bacterium]|nr:hypothetical protein [Candidatus Atribacteria bacterium]